MNRKIAYFLTLFFLINITKGQVPSATIVPPAGTLCTETFYTFISITENSPTVYTWSVTPNTGVEFLTDANSPNPSIKFKSPITYSVSLIVGNSNGTFTTGVLVSVFKSAKASYNASLTTSGFPVDLVLTNYSSNALGYNWDFNGAVPTQTTTNLVQSFSVSGQYSMALIAFGSGGCNDTLKYNFVIDDISDIQLTNVFTPNNDGVNDVFKPITKGLKEMKLSIFNRWGNLMYEFNGVNDAWDGHTTAGIECPDGVYFYVIEATGFDSKSYKLKNTLTLIR